MGLRGARRRVWKAERRAAAGGRWVVATPREWQPQLQRRCTADNRRTLGCLGCPHPGSRAPPSASAEEVDGRGAAGPTAAVRVLRHLGADRCPHASHATPQMSPRLTCTPLTPIRSSNSLNTPGSLSIVVQWSPMIPSDCQRLEEEEKKKKETRGTGRVSSAVACQRRRAGIDAAAPCEKMRRNFHAARSVHRSSSCLTCDAMCLLWSCGCMPLNRRGIKTGGGAAGGNESGKTSTGDADQFRAKQQVLMRRVKSTPRNGMDTGRGKTNVEYKWPDGQSGAAAATPNTAVSTSSSGSVYTAIAPALLSCTSSHDWPLLLESADLRARPADAAAADGLPPLVAAFVTNTELAVRSSADTGAARLLAPPLLLPGCCCAGEWWR